jgi:Dolichyl-phosphate-mannose-protein mannosyltransferase
MSVILPLLCFLGTLLLVQKIHRLGGWRASFLFGAIIWGVVLTAMTEALSLLRWIAFWPLLGGWTLTLLVLSLLLNTRSKQPLDLPQDLGLLRISRFEIALLLGLLLILVATGVTALVAPPNFWDSMTYHMSRVVHWVQDRSVANYPTHILRQLYMNPWSEFAILHLQVLSRGDRFANLVEWASMVGSVVGVSLLAKELGADRRGQIFAAVVCATIPMGILQASSTQTDYVVSFWLVCFVYFTMLLRTKPHVLHASATGAALGLAILTKATAYLYALPFAVWVGASVVKARRTKGLLLVALALTIALATNLGHYGRNYGLFGTPLGPSGEGPGEAYTNDVFTWSALVSNVSRNVGLEIGTPFGRVNRASTRIIYAVHELIGISPSDSRTTWESKQFKVPPASLHESFAGSPLHLILLLASALVWFSTRHGDRDRGLYILSVGLGFLVFCGYLRWQPWHNRLHLPLFVLSAPFIGLVLGDRVRNRAIANSCMLVLIVVSLPWVFKNKSRPLLGRNSIFTTSRTKQYFKDRGGIAAYIEATRIISGFHCQDVGMILGKDNYEYPLWILLRNQTTDTLWLEHVNVTNESQKYARENHSGRPMPCAIFDLSQDLPPSTLSVGGVVYSREWSARVLSGTDGFAGVYTRSPIR